MNDVCLTGAGLDVGRRSPNLPVAASSSARGRATSRVNSRPRGGPSYVDPMTRTSLFSSISILAAVAGVAAACGGSDSGGSSGTPNNTCGAGLPTSGTQGSACDACEESKCAAQLSTAFGSGYKSGTFGGACQALLQCTTACGCNDTSCVLGCQPKLDAGCQTAMDAVDACKAAQCKAECSSGAGGSGAGGSGAGGSPGSTVFACTRDDGGDKMCMESTIPQVAVGAATTSCTDDGGTAGTACATAGLLGTCTLASAKAYYYTPSSLGAANLEAQCKQANGTWTAN